MKCLGLNLIVLISARPVPIGKPLLIIKFAHPRLFVLHGKFFCGFFRKQKLISTKFSPSRRRKKKLMFAEVEAVTVASGEEAAQHRCLRCCGCAIRPC
jgi:hypothetical protein